MIRRGDQHYLEWRFGMASRFYSTLFAAMMWSSETEINQMGLGFPEEVDSYRKASKESGYFERIEAEWRAAWPSLYASKTGGPTITPKEPVTRTNRGLRWLLRRIS